MHDLPVHGVADRGKGDGGPDADREARYEKEGAPFFPADVVCGYFDQIHRSSPLDQGNRVAVSIAHSAWRKERRVKSYVCSAICPLLFALPIKNTLPLPQGPLFSAPRPVRPSFWRAGWDCIRR